MAHLMCTCGPVNSQWPILVFVLWMWMIPEIVLLVEHSVIVQAIWLVIFTKPATKFSREMPKDKIRINTDYYFFYYFVTFSHMPYISARMTDECKHQSVGLLTVVTCARCRCGHYCFARNTCRAQYWNLHHASSMRQGTHGALTNNLKKI